MGDVDRSAAKGGGGVKATAKPEVLVVVAPAIRRQLVKRLKFHLRLIDHVYKLAAGDGDPSRSSFIRASLNLEAQATHRLIARLGVKA